MFSNSMPVVFPSMLDILCQLRSPNLPALKMKLLGKIDALMTARCQLPGPYTCQAIGFF